MVNHVGEAQQKSNVVMMKIHGNMSDAEIESFARGMILKYERVERMFIINKNGSLFDFS